MKLNKIFVLITALAVVGTILGNLLYSWVFFTLTISTLSLFVISSRVMPSTSSLISVSRKSKERKKEIYVNDEIEIDIILKNEERRPVLLEVHDILPSLVEIIEGSNRKVIKLEGNEEKEMSYKISCPITGKIDIGPIKIKNRDPLDFVSKDTELGERMTLRVLPQTQEMQSVDIHPSYTKHWLGDIKSKNIGIGSEFFALREYHPGDEIRDINWKATAKHFEPFTNEYEGEKSGDVILVVDGYKKGMVGTERYNSLRVSVDAAASLASSILSARNRLGLIVSGEYMNWVYPGTGKNHYHKVMANLTQFEKGGAWDLEGVRMLLEDFFPRKSLIIFISPLTIMDFTETIIDLSRKEYDVMVISPNPLKIEKELLDDCDEIAESLIRTERKNIIDRLWSAGTTVVDWDPSEPLEPALQEVLRYKEKM
ncbi:MAG: DUF58 domain-containing protein [Candidatus Natronoplasma sp.]